MRTPGDTSATSEDVRTCIKDDELYLACRKSVPLMRNASLKLRSARRNMPVVKGCNGASEVAVLIDTGCSGVVVKKEFVSKDQYTGDYSLIMLVDNTVRRVPTVKIQVHTPYLTEEADAQCLPGASYDLIIGNVSGARQPD